MKNVISGKMPDYSINLNKIQLSKGTLDQVIEPEMSYTNNELYIDWLNPDHLNLGVEDEDTVQLCIYRPENRGKKTIFKKNVAFRKDTFFKYPLTGLKNGEPVYVWIFLIAVNGKKVSDSQYLGGVNVVSILRSRECKPQPAG